MRNKPQHSCLRPRECAACAYELAEQLAKKKPKESCRYVWMVIKSDNPCDIRRYAFTHKQAIEQLLHARKNKYIDPCTNGVWTLFKLVRVNKKSPK